MWQLSHQTDKWGKIVHGNIENNLESRSFHASTRHAMDVLLIFSTIAALFGLGSAWTVENIGSFPLNDAAFASILPGGSPSGGYDLVVSSFNAVPTTLDIVTVVRDVGSQISGGVANFDVQILADGLLWPNEVEEVPGNRVFSI